MSTNSQSWSNTHTHTHPFNGPFSGTTRVGRYQKGQTNVDFTEARDSEWQWHPLGHMQVCTSLQTDNHASTPPLCLYRPDALPAAQPTVSKHWKLQSSSKQPQSQKRNGSHRRSKSKPAELYIIIFITLGSKWSQGMTKIRLITKYIGWQWGGGQWSAVSRAPR